jgi:hypothetical protein
VVSNTLDMKLRDDLERLKKIRAHRGLRHYCARPHAAFSPRPSSWPASVLCPSGRPAVHPSLLIRPFPHALRGPPCAWPAHKDHRPEGTHRRRVQEKGLGACGQVWEQGGWAALAPLLGCSRAVCSVGFGRWHRGQMRRVCAVRSAWVCEESWVLSRFLRTRARWCRGNGCGGHGYADLLNVNGSALPAPAPSS